MWKAVFWLSALLLLAPLPFKIYGYLTGRDTSPTKVRIEEMANSLFLSLGLIAVYGYAYQVSVGSAVLWYFWFAVAVAWSLSAMLWSAKLERVRSLVGTRTMRILAGVSTMLMLPLFIGVYLYASKA
jgi:hypothetical protein